MSNAIRKSTNFVVTGLCQLEKKCTLIINNMFILLQYTLLTVGLWGRILRLLLHVGSGEEDDSLIASSFSRLRFLCSVLLYLAL